jgi:phospholipid/cholesterol/gamma-HCH transport system substrate-binding protein
VIRRSVLVKVAVFTVIAVFGVVYVLTAYVGVGATLFGRQYTAYVDLADSGGIFTTASVTYRGIEIGRVGTITLRPGGIRVAMTLNNKYKIPTDVKAVVGDGSPIGEQFIDLRPQTDDTSDHLHGGSVIPVSRTSLPVNSQDVLVSLDRLVNSVPRRDLHDLVDELGAAFSDTGPSLQKLLDSTHSLVQAAQNDLPQTIGLLNSGKTVLDTQNDLSNDIVDFSKHLDSFTKTLRSSDGDLRKVIENGSPASAQLTGLVHSVDATLPIVLGNLVSVGQVTQVRIPALRQILIIYPYVVATSYGLFPNNQSTRFGIPIPPSAQSEPCTKGYIPTSQRRLPTQLKYPKIRYNSYCKAATTAQVNPRGSREAPEPDGKRLGDVPSYKNNTGLPGGHSSSGTTIQDSSAERFTAPGGKKYVLGSTGGQQRIMGDSSYQWLLFGPLS